MKKLLLIGLIAIGFASCGSKSLVLEEQAPSLERLIKEFEWQLKNDLEDDNIEGSISAAIVKEGKIIWLNTFGYSDKENQTKADSSTIYRVGSISKSFTAFLMMQMVEEGTIQLEEAIDQYFPEIHALKGHVDSVKITFQQLASHTSGLQREPDLEDATIGSVEIWEEKVLESIPHTRLQSEQIGKYNYSNIGYGILGLVLSRAAKKPYIELVKEKIFSPLEMSDTYFQVPDYKLSQLAKGMEGGPFGALDIETPAAEHQGRGYKVPNGAIYTTPSDLAKFMSCYLGHSSLLNEESLAAMQMPVVAEEDWWQAYGLGLRLLRDSIISTAGHTGAVSGYTANFMFEKEAQYGVVMMRNYNWGMTNIDLRAFALLRRLHQLEE